MASATFGPSAGDGEELLEELSLRSVGEAVQLQRVLADMQVGLDDDLVGASELRSTVGVALTR